MEPNSESRAEEEAYFTARDAQPCSNVHSNIDSVAPVTPATPISERPPALHNIPPTAAQHVQFRPLDRNSSAIRIRRLRGGPAQPSQLGAHDAHAPVDHGQAGPAQSAIDDPTLKPLPPLPEGAAVTPAPDAPDAARRRAHIWRRRRQQDDATGQPRTGAANEEDCYDSRIVDFLDVIEDPEVATLSSITNIQNSLFVPSLGRWVNRRPTYDLSQVPTMPGAFPASAEDVTRIQTQEEKEQDQIQQGDSEERPPVPHVHSLSSVLTAPKYAELPNDASLEGWREEDIKLLNDHVRHMLHSRRSKIKQRFKGFLKYASHPLGLFVTVYATLITLFGLAWVLFLIGWIYVGDRQLYVINVIDNVLVALFAVVGDGLAPFRAVDTYHMIFVAHYHRKTWKMRQKLLLPKLQDHNDLPLGESSTSSDQTDLEAGKGVENKDEFVPVLSDKEQAKLVHHQNKLSKSHTFYKPHETETHHAFPLRLLITVVVLLDLHSCLQICLGSVTWAIDYHVRSSALTTTILCLSITANCLAGVVISIGDRRTRKKDVLERLAKQELTSEAMKQVRKKKEKEGEPLAVPEKQKEPEKEDSKSGRTSLTLNMPWSGSEKKGRKSSDTNDTNDRKEKEQIGKFDAAALRQTKPIQETAEDDYRVPGAF
ncbi:hypothetical protein B0H63DRAFT_392322 [Podospora didyma]|uniref:Integral membrane protein n=1 Tax=Podospora didyma TaxID=330526 RepID=A0AAE0U1W9_9PEZI|nr:hypothetical protein B0H63DRAFT_392322 [Podospora didyma]